MNIQTSLLSDINLQAMTAAPQQQGMLPRTGGEGRIQVDQLVLEIQSQGDIEAMGPIG